MTTKTMKSQERDELLIRVDERLRGLKDGDNGDIPEIKKHLAMLNNKTNKIDAKANKNRMAIAVGLAFLTGMGVLELPQIISLLGG